MQNLKNNESKNIVIIDYKLGNLFSVKQACEVVGLNVKVSTDYNDVLNADGLILPGVGAFNQGMNNLKSLQLDKAIKEKVESNTPLLGICLGLQLLFTESEEFGAGKGLDLIPGVIKKFPAVLNNNKIKVPHISWNTIYSENKNWEDSPFSHLQKNDYMYFVHSYFVDPDNDSCVFSKTNYCEFEFCSSINKNSIFATQFHPEKSAEKGVLIYKNWAINNNLL
jgi:imidazole glycerol-phosphate synthase subunit HisH